MLATAPQTVRGLTMRRLPMSAAMQGFIQTCGFCTRSARLISKSLILAAPASPSSGHARTPSTKAKTKIPGISSPATGLRLGIMLGGAKQVLPSTDRVGGHPARARNGPPDPSTIRCRASACSFLGDDVAITAPIVWFVIVQNFGRAGRTRAASAASLPSRGCSSSDDLRP